MSLRAACRASFVAHLARVASEPELYEPRATTPTLVGSLLAWAGGSIELALTFAREMRDYEMREQVLQCLYTMRAEEESHAAE